MTDQSQRIKNMEDILNALSFEELKCVYLDADFSDVFSDSRVSYYDCYEDYAEYVLVQGNGTIGVNAAVLTNFARDLAIALYSYDGNITDPISYCYVRECVDCDGFEFMDVDMLYAAMRELIPELAEAIIKYAAPTDLFQTEKVAELINKYLEEDGIN